MRNIKYTVEEVWWVNGEIITIGSRDKYVIPLDTWRLVIYRYDDGRTVNEKHTYKMVIQDSDDTDVVYIKTNDIIMGVWGRFAKLHILRPIFKRE